MLQDKKKFLQSLPKKRVAAGALFLNYKNELLMVKSNYKDHWSLPGGIVDKHESPLKACIREVREEIGLKVKNLKLVGCVYVFRKKLNDESIQFHFYGGRLSKKQIENIVIAEDELEDFKFVKIKDVSKFNKIIGTKIRTYLKNLRQPLNNLPVYFEEYR